MRAALVALLAWWFAPPPPPPLLLPLPARLVPAVERTIGEAVQGAYLLGVANGAALWIPVGAALAFVALALIQSLRSLSSMLAARTRLAVALAALISPRRPDPPQ